MPDGRACESYEGCAGRGWIYDPADSGSGRTCYCDCPAGDRLRIEDEDWPDDCGTVHERSEHRAEAVTRWDGGER